MHRRRKYRVVIRQLVSLVIVPLVCMGTAYALFSQQLSVDATGPSVSYTASNSMFMTYSSSSSGVGPYTYTINPLTLYNNHINDTAEWTVTFVVPVDVSSVTCGTAVSCSFNKILEPDEAS